MKNTTNNSPLPQENVDISLVIPCYNEEAAIPIFYKESLRSLETLLAEGLSIEFIFVDDGSRDATSEVIKSIAQQDSRVRFIIFSRNFGKEAAMFAGMEKAAGNYVVTLDVDLQHPPSLIPQMFDAVKSKEFDCAGCRRVTRKGDPAIRSFFARLFYRIMSKLADIEVVDGAGDFRLMSRAYVDAVLSLAEHNRFSKGIFPWVGFKTKWFEYENINRSIGETKWSFWKLFAYSIDGIIAFSTKPLAIASVLGVILFFASLVSIIFVIINKYVTHLPDSGWSTLMCLILFVSGIQLFCIGIAGQYIAKTYLEVKHRPHYIVMEEK